MIYNTQRKKLPMPEYGRGIQEWWIMRSRWKTVRSVNVVPAR